MKALMTNSTHPDIFAAKMRDQIYIKHLREVQKINNRQNISLKTQIRSYHDVYDSYQKSRKQAKQFDLSQQNIEIQRKNEQMNIKMKNIRSMLNFPNNLKAANRSQSLIEQHEASLRKQLPKTDRYQKENEETQQINQISQQISQSIIHAGSKTSKVDELKTNRLSLHYYLRKRQQEMIEHENKKLKNGILTQKSVYSSPKKLNKSIKLPAVKSARHNFNQHTFQTDLPKANNADTLKSDRNDKNSISKQQSKQ